MPTFVYEALNAAGKAEKGRIEADSGEEAMAAIRSVVITAWEIDGYGDIGDGQKLKAAYNAFINSVTALETAYGSD